MEQIRIIKEMRRKTDGKYPRFMVWENVPGAFSSNKGEDFRAVLEETAKVAEGDACIPGSPNGKWPHAGCIMGDGWSIAWRVHDAQFWGVPQRRKRIALVADFGGETAPEILFERKGMSGNSAESGEERKGTAEDAERGIRTTGFSFGQSAKARSLGLQEECSPTLRGGDGGNQKPCVLIEKGQETTTNAERGVGETGITCLNDQGGSVTGDNQPAVCCGISSYESNAMKSANPHSGVYEAETSRTLDLNGGNPACNQGGIAVVSMATQQAVMTYQDHTGTVDACISKGTSNQLANNDMFVANASVVRRLTPLECERLQGFPDHWTDIGDWVDSKGKKHKGESDSPRYKALGNSIALPFWQWMAEKMVKYVDEQTMASLFDGIGGFPLVFSRCGCTPVWASEIEEFPIAVTKIRFPE
jgi:DNA (cytosine-5)-methyltransferase 1